MQIDRHIEQPDDDHTVREVCAECGCVLDDEPHDVLCSFNPDAYEDPRSYEREDEVRSGGEL